MAIVVTRASSRYLERIGLIDTRRGPVPRSALPWNKVHAYPLSPPLPRPDLKQQDNGDPSPDRSLTSVWPNGVV